MVGEDEAEKAAASDAEDLEWLERFKSGNRRAFEFFVKKYQRRLFRIIYNMTSSKEDTADLLQDVFLKAFRSLETFKGQSKFYTWLCRIAINKTLDFLDARKRKPVYSLETWGEGGNVAEFLMPGENIPAADRAVLLKELQEKLNEALQQLSHNHRTVVVLFEIEGMSHAEIAKTLQCSEGTVRSRLHYAKEQLKQSLSRYLKDHGGTTEV